MRDNSGRGKSNNNMRDPTLEEHAEERAQKPTEGSRAPSAPNSGDAARARKE